MIFLQIILLFLGGFWAPWWWVALVGFAGGVNSAGLLQGLARGFLSVFAGWGILSYYYDLHSHGVSSLRIANILSLPYPWLSLLVTAALGGIVSACWGGVGHYFRVLYYQQKGRVSVD